MSTETRDAPETIADLIDHLRITHGRVRRTYRRPDGCATCHVDWPCPVARLVAALRATDVPSEHSTHRDVDEACPECHRDASDDGLAPVRATDVPLAEGLHCEGCAGWVEPSYLSRIDCPGIALATPEPDA